MRERQEAFRDARLIVIAAEGKDTERIYFKALAKECDEEGEEGEEEPYLDSS